MSRFRSRRVRAERRVAEGRERVMEGVCIYEGQGSIGELGTHTGGGRGVKAKREGAREGVAFKMVCEVGEG